MVKDLTACLQETGNGLVSITCNMMISLTVSKDKNVAFIIAMPMIELTVIFYQRKFECDWKFFVGIIWSIMLNYHMKFFGNTSYNNFVFEIRRMYYTT